MSIKKTLILKLSALMQMGGFKEVSDFFRKTKGCFEVDSSNDHVNP